MNNALYPKRPRKSTSISQMKDSDSSDPDFSDWESLQMQGQGDPDAARRQSTRTQPKGVKYTETDSEEESQEANDEEKYDQELFVSEQRIEHVYLSRESSQGLEYLVTFQNTDSPFAQWIPATILNEIGNCPRQLQKFNETEMEMKFYSTFNHTFDVSYKAPMHILSHKLLNDDPASRSFEYLYQFALETGTVFFWELQNGDTPQNLVDDYLKHRKCVRNSHPQRPRDLQIPRSLAPTFRSVEGKQPRDYQIDGVNWMLRSFGNGHGCILADEMGLGKTIQSIVFLEHLDRTTDWHGPHLIAVRTNTFDQWCSELEKWSDLKYIAYSGQPETRRVIEGYQMPYVDDEGRHVPGCVSFNILLVTYDIFLKDLEVMKKIDWQIMIVDEGHRIKNNDGKKHNALTSVNVMNRIILTGTPIQNSLMELWTLLNFVSPSYFDDPTIFPEDDVESLDDDVLTGLRRMISPHLMHRSLTDVERTVVPKDERIAFLKLTDPQKDLLRLTKLHELWRVKKGGTDETQSEPNMMQRICNHPFLIDGARDYFAQRSDVSKLELMINCSAKLIFLDRILPVFKRGGSSVLVFSQRVKILKLLGEYCKMRNYSYEMLIGQLTDGEKKAAIAKFCDKEEDIFIFLISTRSGAEGLNLTRANITIIFDPDWNPQNDLQAQGRCHRIGQTQKVDVLRLITYGTYEHEMFARAQRKLKLWTSLLGDGQMLDIDASSLPAPRDSEPSQPLTDSLLCPRRRVDTSQFSVFDVQREDQSKSGRSNASEQIPEPPDLTQLHDFDENETYESVLQKSATLVRNTDLAKCTVIPSLDLCDGVPDAEFLDKFPADPSMLAAVAKKKIRTVSQRVQLDPKMAKSIIGQLATHGYGQWREIHQALNEVCPIDQMIKFCQTATLLHLRACDPARICCFPLLMQRMIDDMPNFDYSQAMCKDPNEWYTPFSKRGIQSSEGSACKLIHGRIHKTCVSFLSQLEHHILIQEWRNGTNIQTFPFNELPPAYGFDEARDMALYNDLMNDRDISGKAVERAGQMCSVIKGEIIRRRLPIRRVIFPFWSIYEVNAVLNAYRSFGPIGSLPQEEVHGKTALLSKSTQSIGRLVVALYRFFASRHPSNQDPLVIPNQLACLETAPPGMIDQITIPAREVNDVVKRLLIVVLIRKAIVTIERMSDDVVCDGGKGWFTIGHCRKLFQLLLRYGCDSLCPILLSDALNIRDRLLPSDIEFLTSGNRPIQQESLLPDFIFADGAFYQFLRHLARDGQESSMTDLLRGMNPMDASQSMPVATSVPRPGGMVRRVIPPNDNPMQMRTQQMRQDMVQAPTSSLFGGLTTDELTVIKSLPQTLTRADQEAANCRAAQQKAKAQQRKVQGPPSDWPVYGQQMVQQPMQMNMRPDMTQQEQVAQMYAQSAQPQQLMNTAPKRVPSVQPKPAQSRAKKPEIFHQMQNDQDAEPRRLSRPRFPPTSSMQQQNLPNPVSLQQEQQTPMQLMQQSHQTAGVLQQPLQQDYIPDYMNQQSFMQPQEMQPSQQSYMQGQFPQQLMQDPYTQKPIDQWNTQPMAPKAAPALQARPLESFPAYQPDQGYGMAVPSAPTPRKTAAPPAVKKQAVRTKRVEKPNVSATQTNPVPLQMQSQQPYMTDFSAAVSYQNQGGMAMVQEQAPVGVIPPQMPTSSFMPMAYPGCEQVPMYPQMQQTMMPDEMQMYQQQQQMYQQQMYQQQQQQMYQYQYQNQPNWGYGGYPQPQAYDPNQYVQMPQYVPQQEPQQYQPQPQPQQMIYQPPAQEYVMEYPRQPEPPLLEQSVAVEPPRPMPVVAPKPVKNPAKKSTHSRVSPPPERKERTLFEKPVLTSVLFHLGNVQEMRKKIEKWGRDSRPKIPRDFRPHVNYEE